MGLHQISDVLLQGSLFTLDGKQDTTKIVILLPCLH